LSVSSAADIIHPTPRTNTKRAAHLLRIYRDEPVLRQLAMSHMVGHFAWSRLDDGALGSNALICITREPEIDLQSA
jgi:hypothetical protein